MEEHRNNVGDGAQVTHPEQEALSVSEVLSRAADLLEKPGAWTTGYVAKDKDGFVVEADMRSAKCWCGIGAAMRVARAAKADRAETFAITALHRFAQSRGFTSFGRFNDAPGRTQAEVVSALRQAAEEASQ